ncbi:MAG: cell filamentation protein Fic, partial [Chlorobi bacterium]|nr:cell filamentation protein Fic [Chlorobiota bacterium]
EAPEEGLLVGYGALIETYQLAVPIPEALSLISSKNRRYAIDNWQVLTPRHKPEESLYKQLSFALRYEGINLLFFKKLFEKLDEREVENLIQIEPLGLYSRKIWFLYEWLMEKRLDVADLKTGNYAELLNTKLQYGIKNGVRSPRQRIINNLPGTVKFCPLIRKTPKLEKYIKENLKEKNKNYLSDFRKDMLQKTAAFLLLKDSKASFTIEGESPKNKRTARWGKIIGEAGKNELTEDELLRLQWEVIENSRFVEMGFRKKGGFVGEHDRITGEPVPEHISAKWQDVKDLISGLIEANKILSTDDIDAAVAAASVAFGFVFIHPFEDGNGRIHRYLIHHILAEKRFSQQGIIFPVSASILDRIADYRKTLKRFSYSILDFIEWKETEDHNINVINDTIDYYRYFDATNQAEFLYGCVKDTIERIIPEEISYLEKYDAFKNYIDNEFEMPDRMVSLLVRFLEQNEGEISKRAKEKEFSALTEKEVAEIEREYKRIFN